MQNGLINNILVKIIQKVTVSLRCRLQHIRFKGLISALFVKRTPLTVV